MQTAFLCRGRHKKNCSQTHWLEKTERVSILPVFLINSGVQNLKFQRSATSPGSTPGELRSSQVGSKVESQEQETNSENPLGQTERNGPSAWSELSRGYTPLCRQKTLWVPLSCPVHLFTIGTKMQAEASRSWCQWCIVIYHKFWSAVQAHNCFLGQARTSHSAARPSPRGLAWVCSVGLWNVGLWNTAVPEIKQEFCILWQENRVKAGSDGNQEHWRGDCLHICEGIPKGGGCEFPTQRQGNKA